MKIVRLGFKSETVAFFGIKAAARSIKLELPDPFDGASQEEMREWLLYVLFGAQSGYRAEDAGHYCEWLKRNSWNSPTEWFSEEGDAYRRR